MTSIERCALCSRQTKLINSHIIPKFTVKWLKKTSATGYIRMAKKPNLRKQDLPKVKLLCNDCENRFSKWEKLFAEKIFIPFQEKAKRSFNYEGWLIHFAVSLAWRTVIKEIKGFREESELAPFVDTALKRWSSFLLETNDNPGSYEHHIFFLDFIAETNVMELPDMFQWYLLRGFDSTIVYNSKEVAAYTKLPGFIFWSGIEPPRSKGWGKTLISNSGVMETAQCISHPGFAEFILDRAIIGSRLKENISKKQRERITNSILKDPEKTLNSDSFKVWLAEESLKKQKKA